MGMALVAKHTTTAGEASFEFVDLPDGVKGYYIMAVWSQSIGNIGWNNLGTYHYNRFFVRNTTENATTGTQPNGVEMTDNSGSKQFPASNLSFIFNPANNYWEKAIYSYGAMRETSNIAGAHNQYGSATDSISKITITLNSSTEADANFYLYASF